MVLRVVGTGGDEELLLAGAYYRCWWIASSIIALFTHQFFLAYGYISSLGHFAVRYGVASL